MNAQTLLQQLFARLDADDPQGILDLLRRARPDAALLTAARRGNPSVVEVTPNGDEVNVRLVGPTIGEREALIIRTEVNRALMRHIGPIRRIVIDFTDITIYSTATIALFSDLRRNARIFHAEAVSLGVPQDMDRAITRLDVIPRRRSNPLRRLIGRAG